MSTLTSKLSLLDASNTETVEARLNAVLHKMAAIAEKREKEPQADPEKLQKVRGLLFFVEHMNLQNIVYFYDSLVVSMENSAFFII